MWIDSTQLIHASIKWVNSTYDLSFHELTQHLTQAAYTYLNWLDSWLIQLSYCLIQFDSWLIQLRYCLIWFDSWFKEKWLILESIHDSTLSRIQPWSLIWAQWASNLDLKQLGEGGGCADHFSRHTIPVFHNAGCKDRTAHSHGGKELLEFECMF